VLGFTTGPLERLFKTGGGEDLLREALKTVLGVDWRIETTLSGPAAADSRTTDESVPAAPPPPPTPSESMAADRAPSTRASASGGPATGRAAGGRPRPNGAAAPTAPAVAIVLDEPDRDDDDADDGESGLALLQRHLGATVIGDGESS